MKLRARGWEMDWTVGRQIHCCDLAISVRCRNGCTHQESYTTLQPRLAKTFNKPLTAYQILPWLQSLYQGEAFFWSSVVYTSKHICVATGRDNKHTSVGLRISGIIELYLQCFLIQLLILGNIVAFPHSKWQWLKMLEYYCGIGSFPEL